MRWHCVPADAPDVHARLLAACRGAADGELRLSLEDGSGANTAVMTNRRALSRWDPSVSALPAAVDGAWSREVVRGDRRIAFFRDVRALLRQAAADGVLELTQAASIAHAISLALDGAGPFSIARAGR